MKKEGIYVNVVENGKSSFYTCPEAGYRYLNNSCNKYITKRARMTSLAPAVEAATQIINFLAENECETILKKEID